MRAGGLIGVRDMVHCDQVSQLGGGVRVVPHGEDASPGRFYPFLLLEKFDSCKPAADAAPAPAELRDPPHQKRK